MTLLHIDIETQSPVDLSACGVYQYAAHPDFHIQILSCALDNGAVQTYDLAHGEEIPARIRELILDPNAPKIAHQASFERICLSRYLLGEGQFIDPKGWACSMILAEYYGLPLNLADLGNALGLPEDQKKLVVGKRLIAKYSSDYKDIPMDEDWQTYKVYNGQDVVSERACWDIMIKLYGNPYSKLFAEYQQSERINDRGVAVDMPFVNRMRALIEPFKRDGDALLTQMCHAYADSTGKTRVTNPRSNKQLCALLGLESLSEKYVRSVLDSGKTPAPVREILQLRANLSLSAVTKYDRMVDCCSSDGRIRGLFMFYGAHTGRYTSKRVQLQNLKKNHGETETARLRDYYMTENPEIHPDTLNEISTLVRTAFVPEDGCLFSDADYSAIEAHVIAWIAGETWRLEAFRSGHDIYCESASRIYGKPVVKNGINGELRARGKVAELALGYQGGVSAFKRMSGGSIDLSDAEISGIVQSWRDASPAIRNLWYTMEKAMKRAVADPGRAYPCYCSGMGTHEISIEVNTRITGDTVMTMVLPVTHRKLFFHNIHTEPGEYGDQIYSGKTSLYGGKLTENLVQAVARDLLQRALMLLEADGYKVVMHIHDEVLVEAPHPCVEEIAAIMASAAADYPGLPLSADGYDCAFFIKK